VAGPSEGAGSWRLGSPAGMNLQAAEAQRGRSCVDHRPRRSTIRLVCPTTLMLPTSSRRPGPRMRAPRGAALLCTSSARPRPAPVSDLRSAPPRRPPPAASGPRQANCPYTSYNLLDKRGLGVLGTPARGGEGGSGAPPCNKWPDRTTLRGDLSRRHLSGPALPSPERPTSTRDDSWLSPTPGRQTRLHPALPARHHPRPSAPARGSLRDPPTTSTSPLSSASATSASSTSPRPPTANVATPHRGQARLRRAPPARTPSPSLRPGSRQPQ